MKWLIGIAAGAAAIYFLRTEKGKEFVEGLKKQADKMGTDISCLAEDLFKKGSSFVNKTAKDSGMV
jgi:gas vesicle protein